ncbi:uncharacterized protein EV422DRAFT_48047 [Fimicolochytrium jonesii]|uniref:uncharacterized protein n=1 Tax=Fimicolochytrium jonesii TaxID=1396493 RepID=UPI0022FF13D5|nr:uncharacterized protein EV422DRAFT_48047 [Fimicolochytrium jonesii]KAI8820979.1 hypothetical protein EV422DRAFT_48047 [Fimicolochytrium jonesii]
MDADIKRWTGLSSHGQLTYYPGERVTLTRQQRTASPSRSITTGAPRNSSPTRRAQTTTTTKTPTAHLRVPLHAERSFIASVLDKLSASQKKHVDTLYHGYLNPAVTNRMYKEVKEAHGKARTAPEGLGRADECVGGSDGGMQGLESVPEGVRVHAGGSVGKRGADVGRAEVGAKVQTTGEKPQALVHHTTDLHDVLEQYDAVKLRDTVFPPLGGNGADGAHHLQPPPYQPRSDHSETPSTTTAQPTLPSLPSPTSAPRTSSDAEGNLTTHQHYIVPNASLNLTKREEWKARREIDATLERVHWTSTTKRFAKVDRLQELYAYLEKELQVLDAPAVGPDFRRLQVYGAVWEKIIIEFRVYGPILAEIKNEYDKTIASFHNDQRELTFLRTKVQKLLAQNENRLLVKFERRKTKTLAAKYVALEVENARLKDELRRKLAQYAAYLPPSILEQKKREDTTLAEVGPDIKTFKAGEDPITMYEKQVEGLNSQIAQRDDQLVALKKDMEENTVPKAENDKVETALKKTQSSLQALQVQSAELKLELAQQNHKLADMAAALKEKQHQYDVLNKEYSELSEAVARKFDADMP